MLKISNQIRIPDGEIQYDAIRSQGPGGQNVNKVSTAIQLKFDVQHSSLPDQIKEKILEFPDRRISKDGVIIIKAQRFRSQEKNREDAFTRLRALILKTMASQKKRKATKPSSNARKKRLETKTKRGQLKKLRGRVVPDL